MALRKLHLYVLARRHSPTAAIDVLSGAGGKPPARELQAQAAIESAFGPLVDSPKSGCYWWCRGPGKVVVAWQFTELGEAEYEDRRFSSAARQMQRAGARRETLRTSGDVPLALPLRLPCALPSVADPPPSPSTTLYGNATECAVESVMPIGSRLCECVPTCSWGERHTHRIGVRFRTFRSDVWTVVVPNTY